MCGFSTKCYDGTTFSSLSVYIFDCECKPGTLMDTDIKGYVCI